MITYFVLKDDEGKAAGCVRLENGRARSTCPCTLLLEDGTAVDLDGSETPLPARALGAAVMQGERLKAWGTVPGAALTKADLLQRLKKPAQPEPPQPEPEPAEAESAEPEPIQEPTPGPEPDHNAEPTEEPPAPEPDDSAALAADFGLLVRHAGEVYESILHPPLPGEGSALPEETKEESEAVETDWCSETDALLNRIRRR